jgi:putative redox protein
MWRDATAAARAAEKDGTTMQGRIVVARATGDILRDKYKATIQAGHHRIIADEAPQLGGADTGPSPYELLLSGLAACTLITLRMYADRKQWAIDSLHVELRYTREAAIARIDRTIIVSGAIGEAERTRLAEIAEKTPVTLTLKSGVAIETQLQAGG